MKLPRSIYVSASLGIAYGLSLRLLLAAESLLSDGLVSISFFVVVPLAIGFIVAFLGSRRRQIRVEVRVLHSVDCDCRLPVGDNAATARRLCLCGAGPARVPDPVECRRPAGASVQALASAHDRNAVLDRDASAGTQSAREVPATSAGNRYSRHRVDHRCALERGVVADHGCWAHPGERAVVGSDPPPRCAAAARSAYGASVIGLGPTHQMGTRRVISRNHSGEPRPTIPPLVVRLPAFRSAEGVLDEHVEVGGRYFGLIDGGYSLEPTRDGGTRLTLRTTYRLTARPSLYARYWAYLIMGDFHRMILDLIRDRSERAAASR